MENHLATGRWGRFSPIWRFGEGERGPPLELERRLQIFISVSKHWHQFGGPKGYNMGSEELACGFSPLWNPLLNIWEGGILPLTPLHQVMEKIAIWTSLASLFLSFRRGSLSKTPGQVFLSGWAEAEKEDGALWLQQREAAVVLRRAEVWQKPRKPPVCAGPSKARWK